MLTVRVRVRVGCRIALLQWDIVWGGGTIGSWPSGSIPCRSTVTQQPEASRSHTCASLHQTVEVSTGHRRWWSEAGKVTVGLAESNESPLLGLWTQSNPKTLRVLRTTLYRTNVADTAETSNCSSYCKIHFKELDRLQVIFPCLFSGYLTKSHGSFQRHPLHACGPEKCNIYLLVSLSYM